jgi:hypothetical protein
MGAGDVQDPLVPNCIHTRRKHPEPLRQRAAEESQPLEMESFLTGLLERPLFVLTLDAGFAVRSDVNVQGHGVAADRAVFDVFLMGPG